MGKCQSSHDCLVIRAAVGFGHISDVGGQRGVGIGHDGRDEVADLLNVLFTAGGDEVEGEGLVPLHRGFDRFKRRARGHWRAAWGRRGPVSRVRGERRTST